MRNGSWLDLARGIANAGLLSLLLLVDATFGEARAQPAVCAEVKIQIQQRLSLERQAFDAVLKINNGLTGISIVDLDVSIKFYDEQGGAQDSQFFDRLDDFDGEGNLGEGTGVVPPQTSATARWLIIPSADAGGELSVGKRYGVGAEVSYRRLEAGASEPGETIQVVLAPELIIVRPQPRLYLDYFLPFDVHGDDPFTPDVEPSEPFTLGVRVQNVGYGEAVNLAIESAQPEIIENELGLFVNFEILGGYVQDAPSSPSLLLNFGNIEPGYTKVGRWDMITSLSGQFRELNVNYTHADTLGGALTSLIANPDGEIPGHRLIKDVLVNANGRDDVRDFLAYAAGPDGDTSDVNPIRVYESDGLDTDVVDLSDPPTAIQPNGAGAHVLTLGTTPAQGEVIYVRLASPYGTQIPELTVTRTGDASTLPAANAWVSKSRIDNGGQPGWEYHVNVFDAQPQSSYTIVAQNVVLPGEINGRVYVHHDKQPPDLAPPLAGVLVLLEGQSSSGEPLSRTTTTAHLGRFRFGGVPAGTYQLQVADVDGYGDGQHVIGSAGGVVSGDQISSIALSNGQVATGYAFVKLPLQSVDEADLQVTAMAPTTAVTVDEPFPVLVTLYNDGPAAAQTVSVTVNFPPELVVHSFIPAVGVFNSASRTWLLDGLSVGGSVQLALQLYATSDGAHVFAIEAMHLAPSLIDPDTGNNVASATVQVQQSQSQLALEVGIAPNPPRVLAFEVCGGWTACYLPPSLSPIEAVLNAQGVEYLVTIDEPSFLAELRSGRWNIFLISAAANPEYGSAEGLSEELLKELAAYVHAGAGLIVDGGLSSPRNSGSLPSSSIERLLGAYQDAQVSGPHAIEIDPSVLPPGSYAVNGFGYQLSEIDAQVVGTFAALDSIAVTEVVRSSGRAVAVGFHLFDVVDITVRDALVAALLARVTSAPRMEAIPGDMLNLNAKVTSDEHDDQTVSMDAFTLSMRAYGSDVFLDADPTPNAPPPFPSQDLEWTGWIESGQSLVHNALLHVLNLPTSTQVDVLLTDGATAPQQVAVDIPVRTIGDFVTRAYEALMQEQLIDSGEVAAQSAALDALDDALLAVSIEDFQLAKTLLFGTLETLAAITSVDLGDIRSDIGKAVRSANRLLIVGKSASACPNGADSPRSEVPVDIGIERSNGTNDESEPVPADCHGS